MALCVICTAAWLWSQTGHSGSRWAVAIAESDALDPMYGSAVRLQVELGAALLPGPALIWLPSIVTLVASCRTGNWTFRVSMSRVCEEQGRR